MRAPRATLTALLAVVLLALIVAAQPAASVQASTMGLGRTSHSATLLNNGQVLVVGGTSATAAELYDPASDSWRFTGGMRVPRLAPAAVRLADGRVFVVGTGGFETRQVDYAEIYSPATGRWSSTSAMNTPRSLPGAALLPDGRVLVVGGGEDSTAEMYDPVADRWATTAPSLGGLRDNRPQLGVLNDGRVLVVGGFAPPLGLIEIYDPVADSWTALPLSQSLRGASLAPLPDGRFLIVSGPRPTVALVVAADGTVAPLTPPSVDLIDPVAVTLADGKVLVLGRGLFTQPGPLTLLAQVFDPASGRWIPTRGPTDARFGASVTLLQNGRLLVAGGGAFGDPAQRNAELYNPLAALLGQSTYLPLMRVPYPPPGAQPTTAPLPTITAAPPTTPTPTAADGEG